MEGTHLVLLPAIHPIFCGAKEGKLYENSDEGYMIMGVKVFDRRLSSSSFALDYNILRAKRAMCPFSVCVTPNGPIMIRVE